MTITYLRWKDACSEESADPHTPVADDPLMDLQEMGFLIKETDASVSLSIEIDKQGKPCRWRLHVPKVNILERRDMSLEDFLRHTKPKRKVKNK